MSLLIASAAGEVLFLLLAPFWLVVGGYFAAYGAHSLLVVIEQTAAGFDAVIWPEDRILEYFWKPVYLAGLYVLWLVPVALVAPLLAILPDAARTWIITGAVLAIFWLVFPVSVLSSLSGESRFMIVRKPILRGLARCRRATLHFYAGTFAVLLACGGLVYFGLVGWEETLSAALGIVSWRLPSWADIVSIVVLLPVVGTGSALALLLYGRLLGRLAWIIDVSNPDKAAETEEAEASEEKDETTAASAPTGATKTAVPAAATKETYALAEEPPHEPAAAEPFRWQPGRMPPAPPPRSQWRDRPDQPPPEPELEPERRPDREHVEEGVIPPLLTGRVVLFPFYRTTLKPWFWLMVGATCVALLLRLHISYPF
jgi:hypothetical protein